MQKLIKNWSFLTISNFIQQGLNFLVIVPIARNLEPHGYGEYTIILTVIGIVQVLSSLGLRQVVIREIARKNKFTFVIAKMFFNISFLALLPNIVLMIFYFVFFENIININILAISSLLLLSQILWNYSETLAFGKEQMEYSSIIGIFSSIIWGFFIFLLPKDKFTLINILYVFVAIQFIRSIIYLIYEWKNKYFQNTYYNNSAEEVISRKDLIKQSLPIYFTSLLALPVTQIPILFLGRFSGNNEVAFFGIGSKLSIPISIIAGNLVTAVYPMLSKSFQDKVKYKNYVKRLLFIVACLGITLSLGISLFSKEIILLLFGTWYTGATYSFSIIIWTTLNIVTHTIISTIFLSANKERFMVKLSLFNACLIGTFNFVGAFYGATGLAVSTYCGALLSLFIHWYFMKKIIDVGINLKLEIIFVSFYISFSIISITVLQLSLIIKLITFSILFILYLGVLKNNIKTFGFNILRIKELLLSSI